uniref:Uncharacterized protein n=1 Tax=Lepeophtheirus salmonis TaxID=72036 RepID=A0A0K2T1G8_LEPSM
MISNTQSQYSRIFPHSSQKYGTTYFCSLVFFCLLVCRWYFPYQRIQ